MGNVGISGNLLPYSFQAAKISLKKSRPLRWRAEIGIDILSYCLQKKRDGSFKMFTKYYDGSSMPLSRILANLYRKVRGLMPSFSATSLRLPLKACNASKII